MKESTVVEAVGATKRRSRNLSAMLRDSVKKSPHKPAVICGDRVVSYKALDRSASAMARWLLHEGLRPATGGRLPLGAPDTLAARAYAQRH
jgi:acyl-CoA synthetase (AMP-forming)/AMP-acid ligase II